MIDSCSKTHKLLSYIYIYIHFIERPWKVFFAVGVEVQSLHLMKSQIKVIFVQQWELLGTVRTL